MRVKKLPRKFYRADPGIRKGGPDAWMIRSMPQKALAEDIWKQLNWNNRRFL